ncbi:hypothetical protein MTO96_018078 [Rhipicephalus appendiculatus]
MASIKFSDFGPPYSWPILRQLSSAFGWPSERSADVKANNDDDDDDDDDDACSYLPLLDEFLSRREDASPRDSPESPRPVSAPAVKVGQDARSHRCRLIHGLCFEGGEEISLDYLGPSYVNGYDSDGLDSADDSSANEGQAERSIHHRDGGHRPELNRTATGPAVETRSDTKAVVRIEDGDDSIPSTALDLQFIAGTREHFGGEESSPDARPTKTISSSARSAARCFLFVVEDVQSKVQRVRSAIASLFSRNRGTCAEATAGVGETEASVYEFECELNRSEHEVIMLPAQSESRDNRTQHANLGSEQCVEESPAHVLGPVLLEGCSGYNDGDLRSTEAFFPAALKPGRRLNDALENQETRFNDVRITEAALPEHCPSTSELSGSYFDSVCVTAASSPEIRDSSIQLSHELDLNITDDGPANEVTDENATDDVLILDDKPQKRRKRKCRC